MTAPQPEGVPVSTQSVIDVQRGRIAQLTETNIMLEAALLDKEREIAALRRSEG